VRLLEQGKAANLNIRPMLQQYGVRNCAELTQLLAEMEQERALKLALKWIAMQRVTFAISLFGALERHVGFRRFINA